MVYFDLPPAKPPVEVVQAASPPSLSAANGPALLTALTQVAPFPPVQTAQAQTEEPTEAIPAEKPTEEDLPTLNTPAPEPPQPPAGELPQTPLPAPASGAPPETSPEPSPEPSPMPTPAVVPPTSAEASDEGGEAGDGVMSPEAFASQLRLSADFQEYDPERQIITARGDVRLQLNDALLEANELWVNLINRYAIADGNVLLTRGSQIVRGTRAEYNFVQRAGVVANAVGTLYLPEIEQDFSSPLQGSSPATRRAYDPIGRNLQVESGGSVRISTTSGADASSTSEGENFRQLRFETDALSFDVEGWRAEAVRITNDPFSPPELELRADSLLLRNLSPTQDELLLKRPRLVFDQGLALPLLRSRILLRRGTVDPEDLNPAPAQAGIDGRDRGGFYLGRKLPLVDREGLRFSVTPQFFVARAFSGRSSSPISPDNFGLTADLNAQLTSRTTLRGSADLTSLDPTRIGENLRTNIRAEQRIGDHRLALQYSYRERLFNGSLGFQDVRYSLGAVLLSPEYDLTGKGLRLTYQASAQLINAETDRPDLLANNLSGSNRVTLGRYQGSVALSQRFNLWRGEALPATQNEGLRFTPEPIVPYLDVTTGLRATGTYYTSGDFQDSLIADIGLEGQLGHFSRNFGDYTRFNVGYSQSFIGGADSPFLFDREVDRNVLSLGITQQLYGPFLVGFQTAFSLSNGDRDIDTTYSLEYSRRTYGILLRYDATQNTGSIGFRLSNFSWIGEGDPFDTPRVRRVQAGVVEER